tara:strand:- start:2605 stop:4338 length:1734 start_codon:yes stop_codon:yes gene_type:complete
MFCRFSSKEMIATDACEVTLVSKKKMPLRHWIPGQFLTLILELPEGTVHRNYTIVAMEARKIVLAVRRAPGGRVSNWLIDDAKIGEEIKIISPLGQFGLPIHPQGPICFIAGGSGITPFIPMIRLRKAPHLEHPFLLITANWTTESTMYREDLEAFHADGAVRWMSMLTAPNLDSAAANRNQIIGQSDAKGLALALERLDCALDSVHSNPEFPAHFYICGPAKMMQAHRSLLMEHGVSSDRIVLESFSTENFAVSDSSQAIDIVVSKDGQEEKVAVNPGESVLEACLNHGLSIPNSCRMGACGTCHMTLDHGELRLGNQAGLTESMQRQRKVLACQSFLHDDVKLAPALSHSRANGRRNAFLVAAGLALFVFAGAKIPASSQFMMVGPKNTGHEGIECRQCHVDAPGSFRQQVSHNARGVMGFHDLDWVDVGTAEVTNETCETCHARPNDRHPVQRFQELRFFDQREALGVHECKSCHMEHNGVRVTLEGGDFCQSCHADLVMDQDPLDFSHAEIIAEGSWDACMQCHDFHGNHKAQAPTSIQDTIGLHQIRKYLNGGEDPYGLQKEHLARNPLLEE